jgi:hypothetical protein
MMVTPMPLTGTLTGVIAPDDLTQVQVLIVHQVQ